MAGHKGTVLVLQVAVALAIIFFVGSSSSASVRTKETGKPQQNQLEEAGFIYVGALRPDNSSERQATGTFGFGTRAASSLYLSPPNVKANLIGAVQSCKRLQGDLLYILTDQQLEDVQMAIFGIGEPFWTSGLYDEPTRQFLWLGPSHPVNPSYIRTEPNCAVEGNDMGLAVQWSFSSFGLCSSRYGTSLRYICRV